MRQEEEQAVLKGAKKDLTVISKSKGQ